MKKVKRIELVLTPTDDGLTFGAVQALYVTGSTDDPELVSKPKNVAPTLSADQAQALSEVWKVAVSAIESAEGLV